MVKIKELTKEQALKLDLYRDKWLSIGLSMGPLDRRATKEAIQKVYKCAGLHPPRLYIWLRSPLEGCFASHLFSAGKADVMDQVMDQVRYQVSDQVWNQVGAQVEGQVRGQVSDQVWSQVWNQVRDQIWNQVNDQVNDQVRYQVSAQVGAQVRGQVSNQVLAQVSAQVGAQVRGQVSNQVWGQIWNQVGVQVMDQVKDQVSAQVGAQVRDQVGGQVEGQVRDQVMDQVWNQIWNQVSAQVRDQVKDQVMDQIWNQVGAQISAQVGDQVGAQVRDQVSDQVSDQVGAQVKSQVKGQVMDQIWNQVGDQVRDQVWNQVRGQVRDRLNYTCYGCHDSSWLSFYDYFRGVVGLSNLQNVDGLIELAKTAGWCWFFKGVAIVTAWPSIIRFDTNKRLHCVGGPAVQYRDGFSVYAWHGTRVPKEWITKPESIDARTILTWDNLEQRRAGVEIVGWDKIISELKPVEVNRDNDPQIGVLLRVDLPDAPGSQFLKVRCGTGRDFVLPVPAEMKTALQANAWTYGLNGNEYKPEVRT